ncbi:MAG: hypothetical protein ER33_06250 [Cyanobium sp. CACIAM 14]|nr:MAG: hypothetical protein ER33_06250 [Cyanobium sp. CACIAM 14]
MASAVPGPASPRQQPRETRQPVAITCLQWPCDGSLNGEDREWMLQKLSSQEPLGVMLVHWERRHGL